MNQMTDKYDIETQCSTVGPVCVTVTAGISASTPEIEGASATASINAAEIVCTENDANVDSAKRRALFAAAESGDDRKRGGGLDGLGGGRLP
jgi:hypothetical protein